MLLVKRICVVIYFVCMHMFIRQGMYMEAGDNSPGSVLSYDEGIED